jgi:septal ring factor EnvC (AmiA/AmiB activator)
LTRFRDREERGRYMDNLERQMEREREQIQRTIERTAEDSDRLRKAVEKLRSALPSFPGRTPVRGAAERERLTEPIRSETPSAGEESPRKSSGPRPRWRRIFGGS